MCEISFTSSHGNGTVSSPGNGEHVQSFLTKGFTEEHEDIFSSPGRSDRNRSHKSSH